MKKYLVVLGSYILVFLALAGCAYGECSSDHAPASTRDPPLYPGAARVTTQKIYPASSIVDEHISFQTSDTSEAVLAFYTDVLQKEGWEQGPAPSGFKGLSLEWADGCRNHSVYGLLISTTLGPPTNVEDRK